MQSTNKPKNTEKAKAGASGGRSTSRYIKNNKIPGTVIKSVYSIQSGTAFQIETLDGRLFRLDMVRKGARVPMPGQDIMEYAGLAYLIEHA